MTWQQTLNDYLNVLSASRAKRYRQALEDFADWYRGTYGEDPEPELLTEVEGREWRAHLVGVRKYAASTINPIGLSRSFSVTSWPFNHFDRSASRSPAHLFNLAVIKPILSKECGL